MASASGEDKPDRPAGGGGGGSSREQERRPSKAWGILIFGIIGATTAPYAITQVRRSVDWFYTQLNKMQTTSSWRYTSNSSSRGSFSEEAKKRYYQRKQQEYEEEQERVQRIRHMQSVFNRERNKFSRGYESWRDNDPPGHYNYVPRDDWYWQTDTSHSEHKNRRTYTPAGPRVYPMSHHYAVLGLDRSRATPYTDAEVKVAILVELRNMDLCNIVMNEAQLYRCMPPKIGRILGCSMLSCFLTSGLHMVQTAFRTKAMEVHPDQNQDDREAAEEKFKVVVKSYEAIKLERKNGVY